ncbi:MAG TPA: ComEC/Rec2 family competence protein [Pseudolabrys sp.]|jgi:competence protein ComEC|nr:ComEC/Rec2 family competence protein [Pseudolabrys sp.]
MAREDLQGEERRPRAKAWAASIDVARRRAALALPDAVVASADRLRRTFAQWVHAELAPGQLLPWLPVAFGLGIVIYFTADREPACWAALAIAFGGVGLAASARRHAVGFPAALGLAAIAAGFAVGTLQTLRVTHPVLVYPTWRANVAGFVETREERTRSDRIVVRVHSISAPRMRIKPDRVRVAVRKGTAPPVGRYVSFKAHLAPPLQPLRPGGYDFARGMYFQQIGASGFVLGAMRTPPPPRAPGLWLRYAAFLDQIRGTIDQRIHETITGDRGAIASALITGQRDAITNAVNDAMYVSSLAHVLSISGYHMAVVAGVVFFVIRAVLALFASLAIGRPIKKWAAAGALVATTFYLLLSGAEVATQRSYIMIALVLIGVMLDRPALTFRTIAVAAFGVLLLSPQAVVHPSFQMSFAATLALVAAYQHGWPWRADADSSRAARLALWGWREIASLILASTVAGLATTPYAAYHFHRLAPYGVLANLLAMPVVSAWVMPMGILGALATPLGFDAPFWRLMGYGIDWMITVALWVAHLPGALGRIHAFGTGPLLLSTAGLLLVCLLRTPLRWSGAVLAVVAALWALATPQPDLLISADGRTAAVRSSSGRLAVLRKGWDTFALKDWLAADADPRDVKDGSLNEGVRCDSVGCIGHLADGRLVSYALAPDAFAEDCSRASLVISARQAPGDCAAMLIDRNVWRARGAVALWRTETGFEEVDARPASYDRPWAHPPPGMASPRRTQTSADATPKPEDLEPAD